MSERASPFYCPYCGEETIRPFGELDDPHGQWRCDSCRRAFRLRTIRPTRTAGAEPTAPEPAAAEPAAAEPAAPEGESPDDRTP